MFSVTSWGLSGFRGVSEAFQFNLCGSQENSEAFQCRFRGLKVRSEDFTKLKSFRGRFCVFFFFGVVNMTPEMQPSIRNVFEASAVTASEAKNGSKGVRWIFKGFREGLKGRDSWRK